LTAIMSGHLHISISSRGFEANDAGPIDLVTEDVDDLLDAIVASLEGIDFSNITRIRVTGAESGLVVLDAEGRPLRPIIWEHDESSVPDAGWCLKKHDESWWTHETGMVPTFRAMVTKLSWLHRSEPDVWARAARICTPAQYVRWRLGRDTGGPIVASSDEMASTGLWNSERDVVSDAVTGLIDAERDWSGVLPTVRPADSSIGSLYGVLVVL
jgi:sugar (pentulose or hexulose) kinase